MECSNHTPRWIEGPSVFECSKCLYILPATTGLCGWCRKPFDDHQMLNVEVPMCPERKAAV